MYKYFFIALLVLLHTQLSHAASYSWTGSGGTNDWQTNANWSPNTGYPVNGDNVTINKSGSAITINVPSSITSLVNVTTNNITLNFNSSITCTGTVSMTSTVLSPSGTLTIANSGTITLSSCTFNISLTVNNTSSSLITVSGTTFNEAVDLTMNNFSLISNSFKSTTTILKKGTGNIFAAACHDNLFDGITTVTHEDGGGLYFANDNDVFNKKVKMENKSGAAFFYIGNSAALTTPTAFHGNAEFINSSNQNMIFANGANSHLVFDALTADSIQLKFRNLSTAYMYIGSLGAIDFKKAKVNTISTYVPNSSLPYAGAIQFGVGTTAAGPNRVTFDPRSTLYTDSLTVTMTLQGVVFEGQYTPGVTFVPDTLVFKQNNYMFSTGLYNRFDRHVKFDMPNFPGPGGTFNGSVTVIQRPAGNAWVGSTYNAGFFNNDVNFIYKYPTTGGFWDLGGHLTNGLVWATFASTGSVRSKVTIRSESPSTIRFGYLYGILAFNHVDLVLDKASTGSIIFGNTMEMQLTDVNLILKQSVTGNSITIGNNAVATFDDVRVDATGASTGNIIFTNLLVKENISIESITGAANSSNFIINPGSTFNKDFYLKAPNFAIQGGLFKGTAEFYKYQTTGTVDNFIGGTPTFENDFILTNNSSKYYIAGNSSSTNYTFKGNVSLKRQSTGEIRFGREGVCSFMKNLDYQGNFTATPFGGDAGGTCIFNGSADQTISHNSSSSFPLLFCKLQVNKTSGKLIIANPVKVLKNGGTTGVLTLSKGNIQTSSTGLLSLGDDATISGGGKHSYVDGPLKKEGNESPFKFFVGKGSQYFPLTMTITNASTSSTAATFTTEFFQQTIPVATTVSGTLKDLLKCQYWTVDKTGSPNTVKITPSWFNESGRNCSPVDASTVAVARFDGTNWINAGVNNIVSSPGDSGTVDSDPLSSFGYFTLGATVSNTITANDVYAILKKKLDGSYYTLKEGKLYFRFEEEYAVTSGSALNYKLYDDTRTLITTSGLTEAYGDNRYAWALSGLTSGKYYILEVSNSKNEKWILRIKA